MFFSAQWWRQCARSCCSCRAQFCRHSAGNRCRPASLRSTITQAVTQHSILIGTRQLNRMAASDSGIDSQSSPEMMEKGTMSRTHQYRKVMKPLLERKRRARINKCLDELKDLMVSALHTEGESITKLEKADVLELTVRHLRKLKAQGGLCLTNSSGERFRSGFRLCMGEITRFITSGSSGMDLALSARLLQHLSICLQGLEASNLQLQSASLPNLNHHATSSFQPDHSLSDFISPGRVESMRLSHPVYSDSRASVLPSSTTRPSSAPATVVKAEVTVIPEDPEKTWRPW